MKKIGHFFKTVKFWFVLTNFVRLLTKSVRTICSLIFSNCLVLLRKVCAWEERQGWRVEEGKFHVLKTFYHPLHFMFDFYKGLT